MSNEKQKKLSPDEARDETAKNAEILKKKRERWLALGEEKKAARAAAGASGGGSIGAKAIKLLGILREKGEELEGMNRDEVLEVLGLHTDTGARNRARLAQKAARAAGDLVFCTVDDKGLTVYNIVKQSTAEEIPSEVIEGIYTDATEFRYQEKVKNTNQKNW